MLVTDTGVPLIAIQAVTIIANVKLIESTFTAINDTEEEVELDHLLVFYSRLLTWYDANFLID